MKKAFINVINCGTHKEYLAKVTVKSEYDGEDEVIAMSPFLGSVDEALQWSVNHGAEWAESPYVDGWLSKGGKIPEKFFE